ncbi:hypothetical protein [Kitasatospora sp. A2-31]|uniref:hypothetical protein n=1 Tax=Kitasatospora sp. A2-31 TaxID=2916414 RepID=UPI001EED3F9B|nr:hypothetical protein [Kitasatospora sp. A2-31]MCG6498889.1 hypothetical protein [Kitasatospora sp. A2-31]MCG6499480.1 hypothetical protein [Kitasatospora sp. A2-31]MCG6500202.1 hypothetical protein [Kitasatospora sp. A2-31]
MSVPDGEPAEADDRPIELGMCEYCTAWVRGRWVRDQTPHTAIVEHCDPDPRSAPHPPLGVDSLVELKSGCTGAAERELMNHLPTADDPQSGAAVETFRGTNGELVHARRAPMGLIVVQLDQAAVAIPAAEAARLGRRILRLANLEGEGGDQ